MVGDEAPLVIYLPGAIQELPGLHASFGIRSTIRPRRNVQNQGSQSNGIIQTHFDGIMETNRPVQIEELGDRAPSFVGVTGLDGKPAVKPR
jgi:hypothetical protein